MARTVFSRAAMVIRSLLRDNLLSDHVVTPKGERGIVASEVVAELETADEAGEVVPVRDTAVQMAEVRARVTGASVCNHDLVYAKDTDSGQCTTCQATVDVSTGYGQSATRQDGFLTRLQLDRPADTGERVASLAGKYGNFQVDDLIPMIGMNGSVHGAKDFCADVRSMAASLLRQNERGD